MSFIPLHLTTAEHCLLDVVEVFNQTRCSVVSVRHLVNQKTLGGVAIYLPEHAPEADHLFCQLHDLIVSGEAPRNEPEGCDILKISNADKLHFIFDWMAAGNFQAAISQRELALQDGAPIIVRMLAVTGRANTLALCRVLAVLGSLYAS